MPSELDGRPVVEVHETHDTDGNLTGVTTVTRQPRVTADDRDLMYALQLRDAGLCQCGCGQPLAKVKDQTQGWVTDSYVCNARAALEIAQRDAHQQSLPKDKRDKDWKPGKAKPTDGLQFYIVGPAPTPATPEPKGDTD